MESSFAKLSFEKAVRLFREWGFHVEEGPGREEVTLILNGPGHRSYYVYEVSRLPQIAAAALCVRPTTGAKESAAIFVTAASIGCQHPSPQQMLH